MNRYEPRGPVSGNPLVRRLLIALVLGWLGLLIVLPLYGIVKEVACSGPVACLASLNEPGALRAFTLTLWLTLGAVVTNTVMGTLLALVLVRQNFAGKLLMDGLIDLPFAVSPVIAGFMFIILFGPGGWIGSLFEARGIKIIYAFPGMMIATLFVTFPFVVREVVPVLREFGVEQEESAYVLGASKWQTFWRVTLPSIRWGLIYGITLTIARSVGEFGAVLVVSGAIINKTQTATLLVHQKFTDFDYAGAFTAAVVLALISFVTLLLLQYIQNRKG